MSVFNGIIDWAKVQEPIIKEAFIRIASKNGFSDDDVAVILQLLKKEINLTPSEGEAGITYTPFPDSFHSRAKESKNIIFKRMQRTKNVTTIKDETTVPFAHEGVTVIYGENGSGKSGIARVLKQACRSRKIDRVLSNVFSQAQHVPSAELIVAQDGNEKTFQWEEGKYTIDVLSNISVFDSKCAIIQLDSENKLFFVPQGGEIFRLIVSCLNLVKEKLLSEKKTLSLPELSKKAPTMLYKLINDITKAQTSNEYESKIVWTQETASELEKLLELKNVTNEENNKKKQIQLQQKYKKISDIEKALSSAEAIFNSEKIKSFNDLLCALKAKKSALDVLSKDLASKSVLSNVGSDVWRELYLAAKNFSEECYPEHKFPNLGDPSVCVLCQQSYEPSAAERMKSFEKLMEGEIKREYDVVFLSYQKSIRYLKDNFVEPIEQLENILAEVGTEHSILVAGEFCAIKDLANKLIDLEEPIPEKSFADFYFSSKNLAELRIIKESVEKLILEVRDLLKPEKLESLNKRILELETDKEIFEKKTEYLTYINDSAYNRKIDEGVKKIGSTHISKAGSKIISNHIGDVFIEKMKKELKFLGASNMPLSLKISSDEGTVLFDVDLKNAKIPKATKLSDILSEGEVKVISLAVFLAEVGIHPDRYPIITDDPVTSLDHKYREKIAERLVVEGIERQVIIFTHDISFVSMIEKNCLEKQVPLHLISIRKDNEFGEIRNDTPWNAKNVNDRIKFLKELAQTLKEKEATLDQESYNRRAGEIYGFFRETWERFVEEVLFYKVISRFGYEVKTLSLKGVLITDEDFKTVYWGMSKCSRWMVGHDDSAPLDSSRPKTDEILSDIETFSSYYKSCKTRNSELQNAREVLVKTAPTSAFG
jgi:energy-coupling factor transporter ATP-binding protein EcfA2